MPAPTEESPPAQAQLAALSSLTKVARLRLHDSVVDYLRTLIVEATLAPGTRLNERQLCEVLGISRTPLREALKVLAAEGLVEIEANRGATVSQMTPAEIGAAFETMSGIEAFAGELACERISEVDLAAIKSLHAGMLTCKAQSDWSGYYARNREIHDRINLAAGNVVLREIYLGLNRRLQALRFHGDTDGGNCENAIQEHADMLRALEARDSARLSALLRRHLLRKRDTLLRQAPR